MKKMFFAGGLICCLIVLFILLSLLTKQGQGHLDIQTNDPAAKLTLLAKSSSKATSIGTGERVDVTAQAGQYMLQAVDQNRSSRMVVNVPLNGTVSVTLTINQTGNPDKIANFSALDLSVVGTDVRFLNTSLQQIFDYNYVTGQNQVIASDLYPVERLMWINHQQGIAIDNLYNPHLVNGLSDSPISLVTTKIGDNFVVEDFAVNNSGDFVYDQNGNIYLSKQATITKLGQDTALEIQIRLAADDTVFFNGIRPSNPNITTIDVGVATKSTAYFITTTGQKIPYPGPETIDQAAWSPDSQDIAISTSKDLTIYNYKTEKSTFITFSGASPNGSFNWIDANHLLYVDQNTIWEYNLSQNTSYKLAKAPGNINHAVPFAVSDDGIIYFSTDPTDAVGTGAAIYKINP